MLEFSDEENEKSARATAENISQATSSILLKPKYETFEIYTNHANVIENQFQIVKPVEFRADQDITEM